MKRLATGGMGEVWLAREHGIGGFERFAVVKLILPHLASDPKFVKMFLDEARLAALLAHPHIVQILDLGRSSDKYFIAMEYVHGENLRVIGRAAMKRADEPIPVVLAARIMSQVCEALEYAHTRSTDDGRPLEIVHRDVSPQNVIVSYEGSAKILDFGIAKAAGRNTFTKAGDLKGKTFYMSPEYIKGETIDGRSDIFSAGIVLWELVTARRLYKRESDFLSMQAIRDDPAPRPSLHRPDVSQELEEIVMRALEKAPSKRYQSAGSMHLALERYLRGEPTVTTSAHAARYLRRLFPDRAERLNLLRAQNPTGGEDLLDLSNLFGEHVSALPDGQPEAPADAFDPGPPPLPPASTRRRTDGSRHRPTRDEPSPEPAGPKRRGERPSPSFGLEAILSGRAHQTPAREDSEEDDIDLRNVVDPYSIVPEVSGARLHPTIPTPGAEDPARRRPRDRPGRTVLTKLRGAGKKTKELASRCYRRLPGRGRVTNAIVRTVVIAWLAFVLVATAWLGDSLLRETSSSLDIIALARLPTEIRERTLPPSQMTLTIVSHPSGATVVLDGTVMGRTPFSESIPRSDHIDVEIHAPGFQIWRKRATGEEEIEALLIRDPRRE